MKTNKKNLFAERARETVKEEKLQLGKPGAEYLINQAIIWIVIVFLSVMIANKLF